MDAESVRADNDLIPKSNQSSVFRCFQVFSELSGIRGGDLDMVSEIIRDYASNSPHTWVKLLPWAAYWYNTAYHVSAGMTSFRALYGRDPPTIIRYVPSISWPAMSSALDSASMCYKKIQIFEHKGFTLGVVHLLVQAGQENLFKVCIEKSLKSAIKRPKPTTVKLPFSLCGGQAENTRWRALGDFEDDPFEQSYKNGIDNSNMKIQVEMPLPTSSFVVSVDEWQTIQSSGEEIAKWLFNSDHLAFVDQVGPSTFQGVYKGRRVGIEKLKGCDKGNASKFELHRDLLELLTCGHKNILQFYGVCVDEHHGLCVVTKLMEGGSVSDLLMRNRKLPMKEIVRIATDFAEAIKFVNDHDVVYSDLTTQRIMLDRHRNACLGDLGIVTACKILGEAVEYATEFFQSKPFDPGISLTANMLIESTLNVAFVPTVTTDFFLQQILEFNSYEAHKETNLLLGTAIVALSAKGFFVFVAMWPWGILGNDYEGFDMGRKIEEPSLWCIVDVEVKFKDTCSLLFLNIEELLDADDPYRFRLLVMAHIAQSVCGKRQRRRYLHAFTYAQQALSSSLFFPQPCGQGCFDGDGNVMNSAATIGLVNENANNDPQGLRRSTRAKQLPGKYDDFKMQGMVAMWTNT